MSVFVIAEAGVNHNGDEALAHQLVDAASRCGADAIKFQTFSADKLVRRGAEKADYQRRETGDGDQHSMLKALELDAAAHRRLFDHCNTLGLEFMSTPFDEDAAQFLVSIGMQRIKVPSGEVTNYPFLRFLAELGHPLILSTGMADLDEVRSAVEVIRTAGCADLTVLHCTSNYPAALSDVNLRAMRTIADACNCHVGYSDHTLGIEVSVAATALGATVIEKHFTLDRLMSGPDHAASLTVSELGSMVRAIRNVEVALGSSIKAPTEAELAVRRVARRSVTTARAIGAGSYLSSEDLVMMRPGTGIPPSDFARVLGRPAIRDLPAHHTLQWVDLE